MVKAAVFASSELEEEASSLKKRHHDLQRQIAAIDRHLAPSPAEHLERARLKKEKLRIKDRLLTLGHSESGPR